MPTLALSPSKIGFKNALPHSPQVVAPVLPPRLNKRLVCRRPPPTREPSAAAGTRDWASGSRTPADQPGMARRTKPAPVLITAGGAQQADRQAAFDDGGSLSSDPGDSHGSDTDLETEGTSAIFPFPLNEDVTNLQTGIVL